MLRNFYDSLVGEVMSEIDGIKTAVLGYKDTREIMKKVRHYSAHLHDKNGEGLGNNLANLCMTLLILDFEQEFDECYKTGSFLYFAFNRVEENFLTQVRQRVRDICIVEDSSSQRCPGASI